MDTPSPSRVHFKDAWSCTVTPPYTLRVFILVKGMDDPALTLSFVAYYIPALNCGKKWLSVFQSRCDGRYVNGNWIRNTHDLITSNGVLFYVHDNTLRHVSVQSDSLQIMHTSKYIENHYCLNLNEVSSIPLTGLY